MKKLPQVVIGTDEGRVGDQVLRILAESDQNLFERAGALVRVVRVSKELKFLLIPEGGASLDILTVPAIRENITRHMDLIAVTPPKDGQEEASRRKAHPPGWLPSNIAARGTWKEIRTITGIVDAPLIRPDGSIFIGPGYDTETGALCDYEGDFPAVPDRPTNGQITAALDALLEVVADFPFAESYGQAAWVAALLTVVGRQSFQGTAPFFMIDAASPGTGKTRLADAISNIAFGRDFARSGFSGDDEENRKRITPALLSGHPAFLIDNIDKAFGGEAYDRLLTGIVWEDRILGKSTNVQIPASAVWFGTANHIAYKGDIVRRVVPISLQSREEFPDQRRDFKHPQLLNWVRDNRRRLYCAALTILRGFFLAGCPAQNAPMFGSFEDWSRVVQNAAVWAGLPDPCAGRMTLVAQGNDHRNLATELIPILQQLDPTCKGIPASALLSHAEAAYNDRRNTPTLDNTGTRLFDVLSTLAPTGRLLPSPLSLGKQLKKATRIPISGLWLDTTTPRGTGLWFATPVSASASGAGRVVSVPVRGVAGAELGGIQGDALPENEPGEAW